MALFPNSRFADVVGDGTGEINAGTLNGSVTPQYLKVVPAAGEIIQINRMIVTLRDTGTLDSGGYGNGAELTNGIRLYVKRFVGEVNEEITWDITGGHPILVNSGWKFLCFDENWSNYGAGDEVVSWRYTFFLDGEPIIIAGDNKEEFQIEINDDLTGINDHGFRIGMTIL